VTAFDWVVLGVVGASVVLGLWRGVVSEILALAAWVAAFFAARHFGGEAGGLLARWIADPAAAAMAGFVGVFIAVLVVFAVIRQLLSFLLRAVGLGVLDRLLGSVFGVARGLVLVLAGVLLAGMTAMPKESWWRGAVLAPPLETAVIAAKPWLPSEVARRIRYR
jgi:membrane protein required for colicin V production